MDLRENDSKRLVENVVRLGIVALLLYWGILIVAPFVDLAVWGIILAVALGPLHAWLMERLSGSAMRAAILITIAALLFVVVPSLLLGDALGSTALQLAGDLQDGTVEIPHPPASIKDWPVVGGPAYDLWLQASTNIGDLLARSPDRLVELGGQLLRAAGGAIISLFEFAGSILVAGFLLIQRETSAKAAQALFVRLAPESGDRLLLLSEQTVRSVAAGVLGVAIVQSTLVGIGLLVAGVPYAGVWSLLCLLLGILQLPMGMVVTPLVIYEFLESPTTEALLFFAYMAPVMLLDNILRPILMARGVEAPMIVILAGALGGFAVSGFLGLFTGAIILVLVYELFQVWLHGNESPDDAPNRTTLEDSTAS